MINKTILALAHINTRNKKFKVDVVNLDEVNPIAMIESLANIHFSEISIPSFKDVPGETFNVNVGQCVVNSV